MSKTKITVNNNGSLKLEGDFEVVDRNGGVYNLQGREIVSFCRCGLSKMCIRDRLKRKKGNKRIMFSCKDTLKIQ